MIAQLIKEASEVKDAVNLVKEFTGEYILIAKNDGQYDIAGQFDSFSELAAAIKDITDKI